MKYKILILFILSLCSISVNAQTYDNPGNYGLRYKRLKADSSLKVPILPDTLRLSNHAGNGDIIYVQAPTGVPDTGFWGIEKGRYAYYGSDRYNSINYFKQNGNSFGTTAVLGTNGANHLDFETNNTSRMRVFSNGNVAIGTTTDNGYKAQVNGTFNATDNLSYTKSSVTTTFSISEVQNHRYTQINAPGAAGGWQGGVTIATASNGGATANRYWFSRLGALGIGSDMGAAVESANTNSLLIKSTAAAPSGTYGGNLIRLYTDSTTKYTHANGKVFVPIVLGAANGNNIPGIDTTTNYTVGIGYQAHPLVSGWASDLIILGRNEGNTISEIARFCTRDSSLGLRTTEPTSRLDINGTFGYKQLRLRTSYTPTGTADTNGNTGDVAWDTDYIYIKTSAGWKRAALSTF